MKYVFFFMLQGALCTHGPLLQAASTGDAFYGDPPDEHHPWAVHDRHRPQPPVVTPGRADRPGSPPSDAIILFDGTAAMLEHAWESEKPAGQPASWIIVDGVLECVPKSGSIRTKETFGDIQMHLEWSAPVVVTGVSQERGNSGIFLMGLTEVQVLDNYNNPSYADGMAGALYGVNPPLANAVRPPGEFQSIDIVFRRPIMTGEQVLDTGHMTVFINGILTQDATPMEGRGGHVKRSHPVPFPDAGPLKLQDHGNAVRFRNIWVRRLPPRHVEGGLDGVLPSEVCLAKRHELAVMLRAQAEQSHQAGDTCAEMLTWMESLVYEQDAAVAKRATDMATAYVALIQAIPSATLVEREAEIKRVQRAFRYLVRHGFLSAVFEPLEKINQVVIAMGWDAKK